MSASTAAQIAANQANARQSTGPATPAGKAASARNALRHGFRSQSVLLPGDDPAEYADLLAELHAHFPATDLTTERCVREMADSEWRLRRARLHLETLLHRQLAELTATTPPANGQSPLALEVQAYEQLTASSAYFRQLAAWEQNFQRQYDRAYATWSNYQRQSRLAKSVDAEVAVKQTLSAPMPAAPPPPPEPIRTNEPNPPTGPRNAPCPCGSGQKFKRCCGRSAPPVLFAA